MATGIIVFFALILVEVAVARWQRRAVHRLRNSISNLACGAVHGLANAYYAAALVGVYESLRARAALFQIERMTWIHYALLILFLDFLYYWNHRLLHRNKFMWCAHVVHHQSTDYNFTVSLRVSILQVWYTAIFAAPLALAGFPAPAVWSVFIVDKFYQFWVHTRLIGSLGPLEWVLVTPRHHSVHHATNTEYLDRNFGGMFIIWDRLFGTFEPRRAEPVYGIVDPLPSFNPVMANVEPWQRIVRAARGQPETRGVLLPDLLPAREDAPAADRERARTPERGLVAGGLRLLAPVTVLLAFLYTQSAFSAEWVIATGVAMSWLFQLGRFLDEKHPSRTGDAALIVLGAATAAIALVAGWIHLPLALAIGAGCAMLIAEHLLRPGVMRRPAARRAAKAPMRMAA